jgi:hypothetical protein
MNDLGPVLFHLFRDVFDIPARASTAVGVANHLDGLVLRIAGEPSHPLAHGPEAFPPAAGLIASTDDDADFFHDLKLLFSSAK